MRWYMVMTMCALLGAAPYVTADSGKKPPEPSLSKASVESRVENVRRLVFSSSGAQRVKDSGKPAARQAHQKAVDAFEAAEGAWKKRDLKQADRHLDEATHLMFEAIREAGAGEAIRKKKEDDYVARDESVDVLAEALQRIADEKHANGRIASAVREMRHHHAEAERLHAAGNVDAARKEMDAAYETAKVAIESLRGGDTLVRDLNFATKEEEYRYELDRNDTHQMLIKVLVEDKGDSVKAMVSKYADKASKLRKRAEGEARRGDHSAAEKTLEESTRELVRAIRSAGVYIPG
jgi:hypothetical protein